MHVVSIVGARPQFVKLAPIAQAMAAEGIQHSVIHTGQHYDVNMSEAFFRDLRIPDPDVHLGVGSGSHGVMTGRMLEQLDPILMEMKPDWVLVYGDTNSTLAGTVAAVKQHLRVAHLEAGLRSFNRRMPEEHNRVMTDHAADLCLAPTEVAMQHLSDEGLASRAVLVGDVMTDVCLQTRDAVLADPRPVPGIPQGQDYVLATVHRADNTDDPGRLDAILDALGSLNVDVYLPVHPRLGSTCEARGIEIERGGLHVIEPLTYPDMINAVVHARGVVTDSGGLQKEAFLLETVCTTIRTETEWTETVDTGWNALDPELTRLAELAVRPAPEKTDAAPYGRGEAAEVVVRVLKTWQPA
ncbi:non-hydrolyzing UDP-N-acetylglucosamine 2-epimerase [Tessaracoccus sp. Z1128]